MVQRNGTDSIASTEEAEQDVPHVTTRSNFRRLKSRATPTSEFSSASSSRSNSRSASAGGKLAPTTIPVVARHVKNSTSRSSSSHRRLRKSNSRSSSSHRYVRQRTPPQSRQDEHDSVSRSRLPLVARKPLYRSSVPGKTSSTSREGVPPSHSSRVSSSPRQAKDREQRQKSKIRGASPASVLDKIGDDNATLTDAFLQIPESVSDASSLTDHNQYDRLWKERLKKQMESRSDSTVDSNDIQESNDSNPDADCEPALMEFVTCRGHDEWEDHLRNEDDGKLSEDEDTDDDDTNDSVEAENLRRTLPETVELRAGPLFHFLFGSSDLDKKLQKERASNSKKDGGDKWKEEERFTLIVPAQIAQRQGTIEADVWTQDGDQGTLRCNWRNASISYALGMHLEESYLGMAKVKKVFKDSEADACGIKKGDVINFAVALNIANNGSSVLRDSRIGSKLAKRLEGVGMRTSYRELFNLFLSRTTAGWPVAMVFRRPSRYYQATHDYDAHPCGLPPSIIDNLAADFKYGSDFLHDLSLRSRQLEDDVNEIITGNIEELIPRPEGILIKGKNGDAILEETLRKWTPFCSRTLYVEQTSPCLPFFPSVSNSGSCTDPKAFRALVEHSVGLAFLRTRIATLGISINSGSGFILSRLSDGTWSAPSAVGVLGLGIGVQCGMDLMDMVVLIRSREMMERFQKKDQFVFNGTADTGPGPKFCGVGPFTSKSQTPPFVAFAKNHGAEIGASLSGAIMYTRHAINREMYNSKEGITQKEILEGLVAAPKESLVIYGALRSLEFPYNMFSHPIPPEGLKRYAFTTWKASSSCAPEMSSTGSTAGLKPISLRRCLAALWRNPRDYEEEMRELVMFGERFKRFLDEGVPVEFIPMADDGSGGPRRVMMYLASSRPSLRDIKVARLEFVNKRGGDHRDASISLTDVMAVATQEMPQQEFSPNSDATAGTKLSMLICLRCKSKNDQAFVPKSDKDALLILCGLKLLLEFVRDSKLK